MDVTTLPAPGNGNGHGGRRAKAGRPRAELSRARDDLDAQITAIVAGKLPELVGSILDLALGHYENQATDAGPARVYLIPPDFKSASYLLDRIAGKPRQAVEVQATQVEIRRAADSTEAAGAAYEDPDDDGRHGDAGA